MNLQTNAVGNGDPRTREWSQSFTLSPTQKLIQQRFKDLNVKPKTIQLEESIEEKLHDIGTGNDFSDMAQKHRPKEKKKKQKQLSGTTSN